MTTRLPFIGAVVHYVSRGSADGVFVPQHRAAVITELAGDGDQNHVSLCTLNPTGLFFDSLVRHDEERKAPGTWHWIEDEDMGLSVPLPPQPAAPENAAVSLPPSFMPATTTTSAALSAWSLTGATPTWQWHEPWASSAVVEWQSWDGRFTYQCPTCYRSAAAAGVTTTMSCPPKHQPAPETTCITCGGQLTAR
jgi:hypothetical protein